MFLLQKYSTQPTSTLISCIKAKDIVQQNAGIKTQFSDAFQAILHF